MTKELEALDKLKSTTKFDGGINYSFGDKKEFKIIENALKRLEAIDNSNPSEALECLGIIVKCIAVFNLRENGKDECNYLEEMKKIGSSNDIKNIKQTLIKAQEQEIILNLIKEKPLKSACTINYIKANKDNIKMLSYSLYCLTLGVDFRVDKEEFDLLKRWLYEI